MEGVKIFPRQRELSRQGNALRVQMRLDRELEFVMVAMHKRLHQLGVEQLAVHQVLEHRPFDIDTNGMAVDADEQLDGKQRTNRQMNVLQSDLHGMAGAKRCLLRHLRPNVVPADRRRAARETP